MNDCDRKKTRDALGAVCDFTERGTDAETTSALCIMGIKAGCRAQDEQFAKREPFSQAI